MNNFDFLLISYLIICRLIELIISKRNTTRLIKEGAKEFFPFHYKFLVLFHITFIIYFMIKSFGNIELNYGYISLFIFIQLVRFKVIFDLGKYWTTRIIVVEKKLIKTGLYRFFRHPNYIVVFFEIILICLIFNDYTALLYFSLINTILIFIRIYYEERANKKRY